MLGIPAEDILRISAKTGEGVPELLDAVDRAHPAADRRSRRAAAGADLRQPVRPVPRRRVERAGDERPAQRRLAAAVHAGRRARTRRSRSACARPVPTPVAELGPGEVGYLIAGIKDVGEARSRRDRHHREPRQPPSRCPATATPSRWCSPGCSRSTATTSRTCASRSQKLKLNDASITYTPESSGALGFGFRCGFLGLLHMEIVKERLEREFDLALIATAPSVEYRVHRTDGELDVVDNPADLPEPQTIDFIEEPYFKVSIITPKEYTGTLMELCQTAPRRARRRSSTCRPSGSSCTTRCRSPRSSSTSSTR